MEFAIQEEPEMEEDKQEPSGEVDDEEVWRQSEKVISKNPI